MCLLIKSKQSEPKVSRFGRTCYKVLTERKGDFYTPILDVAVNDEILEGKKPFEANCQEYDWSLLVKETNTKLGNGEYMCFVDNGFIHAFTSLKSAKGYIAFIRHQAIFRCEIPAGTEYYEGTDNEICARKIIFKKLIDKNF